MGGLVAVLHDQPQPVNPAIFHRLCHAVRWRCPDGVAPWHGTGASIARLRFVTTDGEDAPETDPRGSLVVAFDGRLDNRDDLIDALGVDHSASDARLALEAMLRWDADAATRLLGDFAFVAWDPARRRAVLARDHMGIRPLHFARLPGATICATDVAHILSHPGVSRRANEPVVAQFLACAMWNSSQTLIHGVSRVPPAHVVVIEEGNVVVRRYWSPEPRQRVFYRSDDEYGDHCRELLVRSVSARMRSSRPIAATLSGGIDSSSVALTAHLLVKSQPPPQLFSMVFPGRHEADERRYIEAVAERCGADPVLIAPSAPTRSIAGRAATWMDVPSMAADSMAEGMWNQMSAAGYRVALTGAGGDFVYAGSIFHHADLLRSGRVVEFARRYRDDGRAHDTGRGSLAWLQAGLWPALPVPVKRAVRPAARWAASRMGVVHQPRWLRLPLEREPMPERPRGGSFAVEELVRSLTGGLHSFFLEGSERAGAEALLELRHPLLDVRLTEFVLAIPEEQRRRGPILKFVLRHALRDELPPILASRTTKGDFAHCVWDALETLGGERFFTSLAIADAGWVDGAAVLDLYRRMRDDVPRGPEHYGRHVPEIWMITAIELWFRAIMEPSWTTAQ
jgi:asparagine synthase (glutamine-hydrolysing)